MLCLPPQTVPGERPGRWRRVLTALVGTATLGLGVGACHGPSLPIGLSTCYQSIPLAEGALNVPRAEYSFNGVKLVSPATMVLLVKRRYPHAVPASLHLSANAKACAFAFTGRFVAGEVAGAPPHAAGRAAIVLTTTGNDLLFSFVIASLPERFSRTFTRP